MQVLGTQNYFQSHHSYPHQQLLPSQSSSSHPNNNQKQNPSLSQKKKPNYMKSKRSLNSNLPIQDFKQNQHKHKQVIHNQASTNRNSNKHLHMIPFSSVCNTKGHNKNIDSVKNYMDPIKNHKKNYQSQSSHTNKKNEQNSQGKHESRNDIQKIIQNKLNHILQNKRKSISYRIHVPPKENLYHQQPRKQSYHQIIQTSQKEKIKREQRQNIKKEQRAQQQDHKAFIANKQKSSQSFIIRKKINSNALQSNRMNKYPKNFEKQLEKYQNQMKKYNQNQKNTKNNIDQMNPDSKNISLNNSQTLSRYQYKPMEEQINKLRQKYGQKDISVKHHHIKGIKCLKVRVNKVLKAQQQLFHQISLRQQQKQTNLPKQQHVNQANKQQSVKRQTQIIQDQSERKQQDLKKKLTTIQDMIEQAHQIKRKQEIKNFRQKQLQEKLQQLQFEKRKNQNKWKSYKQTQSNQNIKNRKSRISSIKAIKNYYRKLQTEEKSSFMEKQNKQITTIKKKQKQPTCLTHKIKWGNSSKKKLNSDRGIQFLANNMGEFSIDETNKQKKQAFNNQIRLISQNTAKNTIQAKLNVPTIKKKTYRVEFAEDQRQTGKFNQCQVTPKNNKNLDKIFAQTINSHQFIDYEAIPYHTGSKSLIIFQDPGISMIANNNSIHAPNIPIGLTTFERPSAQIMTTIQRNDISPVAVMKKRLYDGIQERNSQDNNALQSLQELFYELKSKKQIKLKTHQEYKVESLQELCEE